MNHSLLFKVVLFFLAGLYFILEIGVFKKMDSSFDDWRKTIMQNLDQIIKTNRNNHLYVRPELTSLNKDTQNPIQHNQKVPESIRHFVALLNFYAYNSEGIRDYGWGCAWRCIESIVNNFLMTEMPKPREEWFKLAAFETLFYVFGQKENLMRISEQLPVYVEKPETVKELEETKFAPYTLENGWAEPFIGLNVLKFFGIKGTLFAVNSWPTHANAPNSVSAFSLNFEEFTNTLLKHFLKKRPLPVMIDDGTWALCIIGIGLEDSANSSAVTLWIADPHIKESLSSDDCSFYTVQLDSSGIQLGNSISEDQSKMMYNKNSYEGIFFREKNWMVLLPESDF